MNKSKFLKKSLAMLLAIMMVVAMIPLSAAAEDAPEPVDPPVITVNSQYADYDAETKTLSVKVEDTASVDITRGALTGDRAGWEVYVVTKTVNPETQQNVELKLPTYYLDLTKQAEKNEDGTYSLPMKMYDETDGKKELKGEYTLVVTEDRTVAFDSADLRTVRVNQSWKEGASETTVSAISGEHDNAAETISIVLPLGLTADKVGLGQNMDDEQARRIFVPESPSATVEYLAPTTDQTKATVKVTARDGKTKTFNVTFSYEQVLTDIEIVDRVQTSASHIGGSVGTAQGISMDANGDAVIYIPVGNNTWAGADYFGYHSHHFYANFKTSTGLVRVEDPQPTAAPADLSNVVWTADTNGEDEPIVSHDNTIRFVNVGGVATAWLTVITKANWDEDDSTLNNRTTGGSPDRENVYANVKVVLSAKAGGGSGSTGDDPKLFELQLEGYQAKVNRDGWEDGDEIDIYVSNDDYITSGWDTYQGKRISALTTSGATVSIPEQSTVVHGPYWQVIPTVTNGAGRLEKREIDNVNIAGHKFNLQISSGGKTAIITVNIKKAAHYVPEMTGFRLYDAKNDAWYEGVQTSYRGDHFVVTLPANLGTQVPVASRIRGEGKNINLGTVANNGKLYVFNGGTSGSDAKWTIDFSGLTSEQDFIKAVADVRGATTAEIEIEAIYDNSKLKLFVDKDNDDTLDSGEEVGYVDFTNSTTDAANLPVKTLDGSKTLGTVVIVGSGTIGAGYDGTARPLATSPAATNGTGVWTYSVSGKTVEEFMGTGAASVTANWKPNVADYTAATPTGLTYSCSIGYTYDNVALGAWLKGLRVYADIGNGTYATPGGKGFGVTTNAFGMNGDANGNGRKDLYEYEEIENHITTVEKIWKPDYTVDKSGKSTGNGKMSDYLVLRVTNSENNQDFRDYTIELRPEDSVNDGVSGGVNTKAEITVGSATTALDNDLVYGGNTISMIAARTVSYDKNAYVPSATPNPDLVNAPAVTTAPYEPANKDQREDLQDERKFEVKVAADPANQTNAEKDQSNEATAARLNDAAAYVGAIKDDENNFPIEIKDIPGVAGAKVLEITVPYNYKARTKPQDTGDTRDLLNDGQKVYFSGVSLNPVGHVTKVRYDDATGKYQINAQNLSLNKNIQDQQPVGTHPMSFVFTEDEIAKAWNGSVINRDVMSKANVLYLYSDADKAKSAGYGATPPVADHSGITPGETNGIVKAEDTMPTMIYYVVAKRAPVSKNTSLSSFNSDKPGQVDVNVNWSQKIIDVSIPYSWNWGAYREDDSHDFTFNFNIDKNATLIDVMHDTTEVPMKVDRSTSVNVSEYEGKRQNVFEWVSSSRTDKPATQFFVRNGMLYTFDPDTGDELQITGIQGNKDEYRNYAHGVITSKDTELRIYDQDKKNINTYKLRVNIKASEGIADIKTLKVGETFAELAEDGKTYNVKLTDEDQASILMEITTASALAAVEITTVDGTETYNADNYLTKRWNLTEGATIKVTAEDGTSKVYNLVIGEATVPTPSPTPSEDPTPTPTPDIDVDKYTDLDKLSESVREEVIDALKAGLVQGISETEFGVGLSMRRYQMALLIARADLKKAGETGSAAELDAILVEKYGTETPFTDLGNRADAAKAAIAYCFEKGYMKGISDTEFNPNGNMSRQEAATAMARVAGLSDENKDVSMFKDGDKIANWAKGYVRAAYDAGLVNGLDNGTFGPTNDILRQHAVCLFTRAFLNGDEPENPDEGEEPGNPDEGEEPSNPDEGEEPSNPDEGEEPSTPDEGEEPSNPDEGGDTSEPSTPDEDGDTSEPTE